MTEATNPLSDRLADEYKILQDKVDKIGAFRFTIKGWSVTVILGALFAGGAAGVPRAYYAGLFLVVGAFWWLEREQAELTHRFGARLLKIERVMSTQLRTRENRPHMIVLRFVPGIAHNQHQREGLTKDFPRLGKILDPHHLFYVLQAALVITAIVVPFNKNMSDRAPVYNQTFSDARSDTYLPLNQGAPSKVAPQDEASRHSVNEDHGKEKKAGATSGKNN